MSVSGQNAPVGGAGQVGGWAPLDSGLLVPRAYLAVHGHNATTNEGLLHAVGCIISSTSTSLSSGAEVSMSYAAADTYDSDAFHDPSGSPTLITVPTGLGGKYGLKATVSWGQVASANTDRRILYRVNGGTSILLHRETVSMNNITAAASATADLVLAAGDTVEIRVWTGIAGQTAAGTASLFLIGA